MKEEEIYRACLEKIKLGYYDYQNEIVNKKYYIKIFSHTFAKAFWGEEKFKKFFEGEIDDEEYTIEDVKEDEGEGRFWNWYQPVWQYHLQRMVIEEAPLKYLEKFL